MNHSLKPDDLAILTTAVGPVAAGSMVQIEKHWPRDTILTSKQGKRCIATEDLYCFGHSSIPEGLSGHAPVRYFMPLQGDAAPVRQKAQQVPA
ncbi:hypothetical protein [Pseudomonas oryzihabitans]|uniref:Uncharacterized protein n=1 Tax=Pseudomonas oryzihabitans TaxID=47885 RepID=A0A2Z5A9T9_9PSED|nr:hypothetical protein [Pseudomonas oryzihabitans]AXA66722.1 hypothetical protein CE139_13135 [Pseudomonas oryzihabitans]